MRGTLRTASTGRAAREPSSVLGIVNAPKTMKFQSPWMAIGNQMDPVRSAVAEVVAHLLGVVRG